MKKYEISEELANALLNYVGKRPYIEVAGLVTGLQQLKEIPEVEVVTDAD